MIVQFAKSWGIQLLYFPCHEIPYHSPSCGQVHGDSLSLHGTWYACVSHNAAGIDQTLYHNTHEDWSILRIVPYIWALPTSLPTVAPPFLFPLPFPLPFPPSPPPFPSSPWGFAPAAGRIPAQIIPCSVVWPVASVYFHSICLCCQFPLG